MILYFHDQLKLNMAEKPSAVFWTVNLMPLVAVLGSFSAGVISDKFFKGHRSPVAMTLYFVESGVILIAAVVIAAGIVGPTAAGNFHRLPVPRSRRVDGEFDARHRRHRCAHGYRRTQNGRLRFRRDRFISILWNGDRAANNGLAHRSLRLERLVSDHGAASAPSAAFPC